MKLFFAFLRLSRPSFLMGGVVGVALGTAGAALLHGVFDWRAYALAQLTISAFHLMTHYSNEYFDREGDAAGIRTAYSGGSGALCDGTFAPAVAHRAALVCAGTGLAGTLALLWTGHGVAAGLAVAIAAGAWVYSAPPVRLAARGLGELDTVAVVAILVPMCAFATQAGWPAARDWLIAAPGAAAMFVMMLAVEYPDREADLRSRKRNLVVRLGRPGAGAIARVALVLTYAALAVEVAAGAPRSLLPLEALTVPPALGLARAFDGRSDGDHALDEAVAARGVAFFFLVSFQGALAFGALLPLRA